MTVTVTVDANWHGDKTREQIKQLVEDLLLPGVTRKIVIEWDGQRGKIAAE